MTGNDEERIIVEVPAHEPEPERVLMTRRILIWAAVVVVGLLLLSVLLSRPDYVSKTVPEALVGEYTCDLPQYSDRYLTLNEQECAGACLDYLRDRILYPQDDLSSEEPPGDFFQRISQLAEGVLAGCDGLIFTPWLYGERTPVDDHLVRGGFFNQSLNTTRAHMVRAVYEGVAYNSRWLLQSVEKLAGKSFAAVNMVGGGAQSDLWCQIHADVFNRTIHQMKEPILVNLRGAAFLASVSLGYLKFEDIPDCVEIERTYQPDPENRQVYDQLFAEFLNLYRRNRPIYARLNRGTF